jgi:hypothetical protein
VGGRGAEDALIAQNMQRSCPRARPTRCERPGRAEGLGGEGGSHGLWGGGYKVVRPWPLSLASQSCQEPLASCLRRLEEEWRVGCPRAPRALRAPASLCLACGAFPKAPSAGRRPRRGLGACSSWPPYTQSVPIGREQSVNRADHAIWRPRKLESNRSNQATVPIGPSGQRQQSVQSGRGADRANRAQAAIGPIGLRSQSGQAQPSGKNRAEVPTGPVWQRQQSGQSDKRCRSDQSDRGNHRANRTEAPMGPDCFCQSVQSGRQIAFPNRANRSNRAKLTDWV